jgi:ATP-binding cassette subfamily F protein 3
LLHIRQQDKLAKEEEFIARFAARASHAPGAITGKKIDKIERIEIPLMSVRFVLILPIRQEVVMM